MECFFTISDKSWNHLNLLSSILAWLSKNELASTESEHFPSISDYFHVAIIFDYFDFHCPTTSNSVGEGSTSNWDNFFSMRTIFFPTYMDLNALKLPSTSPVRQIYCSQQKIECKFVDFLGRGSNPDRSDKR